MFYITQRKVQLMVESAIANRFQKPDSETNQAPKQSSKREQRKIEIRERIMDSAIDLFEQGGCNDTTLEQICELAGVSRPTFYSYFPSKHDLIDALVERLWLDSAAGFTNLFLSETQSVNEYIRSFLEMTRSQFAQYTRLERDLIRYSMTVNSRELANMSMLSALTALFKSVFEQASKKQQITQQYDVDFLAEMSMGVISTVMMKWAIEDNYPLEKRLNQIASFIVDFISP